MKKLLICLLFSSTFCFADYQMQNVNSYIRNASTVTFNGIAQPVSGTFYQTNQPVTITTGGVTAVQGAAAYNIVSTNTLSVTANQGVPAYNIVSTNTLTVYPLGGTFTTTPGTGTVTITGTVTENQGVNAYNIVSSNTLVVNGPALTKGSQGASGLTTQDLKDAGRTYVVLVATGVGGVTSETLFTFQQSKQGVAVSGVTSYTVTSGKTLRIQGLHCASRDGTTAVSWGRAAIRHNPGGATTAASSLIFASESGTQVALAGATGNFSAAFPDGIEIVGNGTQSIGVSHLDQATTNVVTCTLVGYEY